MTKICYEMQDGSNASCEIEGTKAEIAVAYAAITNVIKKQYSFSNRDLASLSANNEKIMAAVCDSQTSIDLTRIKKQTESE